MDPAAQPAAFHTKAGDVLYSLRREIEADSPMSLSCRILAGEETRTSTILHTIPTNRAHDPEIKSPLFYVNIVSNREALLGLEGEPSSTRLGVTSGHDYQSLPLAFEENNVPTIFTIPRAATGIK